MSKRIGSVAVSLLFLILLSAIIVSRARNVSSNSAATEEAVDPYEDLIVSLQTELQRPDLSTETRRIDGEKLETFIRMATQRATGLLEHPTRQARILATPTMQAAGMKLPDGIDDHPSVPFSEKDVKVLNSWRKTTPDRYFLIYAGYLTQDPKRGALLILHPRTHTFHLYLTPERSGEVRVTAEDGTQITLKSENDTVFYFDAAKEQFVDSKGSPAPTAVTTPTATSTALSVPEQLPIPATPYPEP